MNKKSFVYLVALAIFSAFVSCSSDNDTIGGGNNDKEYFAPTSIVIKKSKGSVNSEEKWNDIVIDKNGNIKSFEHVFVKNGVEQERSKYDIRRPGNKMIADIEVSDANGNIIKNLLEMSELNENGLIAKIETFDMNYPDLPVSTKTFEYNGLTCSKFTYEGNDCEITCDYSWAGYKLSRTTERVVDLNTGRKETNIYSYTFDDEEIYPYEGMSMFPFVQSERDNNAVPHIYASLGYFGMVTPYIVKEETQERYITTNSQMGPGFDDKRQDIKKVFDFNNKNSRGEVKYDISSTDKDTKVDLYDEYTITFIE